MVIDYGVLEEVNVYIMCCERLFYLWIIVLSQSDVPSTWTCSVYGVKGLVPKLQAFVFWWKYLPL